MTLRDLTTQQVKEQQKRCLDEFKDYVKAQGNNLNMNSFEHTFLEVVWKQAFSQGLKAGLELPRP